MLALRSLRQRAATRSANSLTTARIQSRSSHTVPALPGVGPQFKKNGIGNFMSPEQFDVAWTQNQARLVGHLNRLTNGGSHENSTTKQILLATARDPDHAPHFNYASMAHNNHFFFSTISPTPTRPGNAFAKELEGCFSSASSFRASFLATAEAMFGPGFVWLVQNGTNLVPRKYAILCTYHAGSPYPGAVFRRQETDVATTPNNVRRGQNTASWVMENMTQVGHSRSTSTNTVPGGQEVTPLMCVSTWEHAYLHDYGVNGKREYLERWWDSIDWDKVEANVDKKGMQSWV